MILLFEQEVGDESKLTQSFQRIRDLVKKRQLMENRDMEGESRLEQIVREVMVRHAEEALIEGKFQLVNRAMFLSFRYLVIVAEKIPRVHTIAFPRDKRSYQEAMNRPISIISYDPPEYQVNFIIH